MIPMVDLKAQYRNVKSEIDAAVLGVLESGEFILGPQLEQLEKSVAALCGTAHAVGVNSGTDALYLSLLGMGVRPGDEVVVPAFTMMATVEPVWLLGAKPVFVDVEPETLTMDVAQLGSKVNRKTKAIIPVHLFGHPADMQEIRTLADKRKVGVIEDAAQAIGAAIEGRPVGSWGRAGCLSFYPTKNLGACGDGGMVVTDDAKLAQAVRCLRDHGATKKYHHEEIGINSRLDEIQAAILNVKLVHLHEWTEARRRHAEAYSHALSGSGNTAPMEKPGVRHVYHQYTIRCPHGGRDRLREALLAEGIMSEVHYPMPLPFQPALARLSHRPGDFPVAEQASEEVLSLPVYPELSSSDRDRVVKAVLTAGRHAG